MLLKTIKSNSLLFTIITVVYNSVDTIEDSILSVISQDYPYIEYIVIDGGSTDGTLEVINKYKDKISIVISENDAGIYDAMNKGIQLSSGDYICTLNSDDFYSSSNIISQIASYCNEYEKPDIIMTNVLLVKEVKDNLFSVKRKYSLKFINSFLLKIGIMPAHPGLFISRNAQALIGPYDIQYQIASDFDYIYRAVCMHKIKFKYLNIHSVYMRIGGVSTRGFISIKIISNEINKILSSHNKFTLKFLVWLRLPIKLFLNFDVYFTKVEFKLRNP
jgi:glycosyltransferase involved in cell wall biosynthesis